MGLYDGGIQDPAGGTGKTVTPVVRVTVITLLLVLSGASSQMSFYATGQAMSGFPIFLLYFCNGCYGLAYFVILAGTVLYSNFIGEPVANIGGDKAPLLGSYGGVRRPPSSPFWGNMWEQRFYIAIGVCTGLSLEMQQFANGKVNGDLQTVLYQLYLPSTAICSAVYLRAKLSAFNVCGGIGVCCGIMLVMEIWTAGTGSQGLWPLIYGFSTVPLGMACVLQEELFEADPNVSAIKMSAWVSDSHQATALSGSLWRVYSPALSLSMHYFATGHALGCSVQHSDSSDLDVAKSGI